MMDYYQQKQYKQHSSSSSTSVKKQEQQEQQQQPQRKLPKQQPTNEKIQTLSHERNDIEQYDEIRKYHFTHNNTNRVNRKEQQQKQPKRIRRRTFIVIEKNPCCCCYQDTLHISVLHCWFRTMIQKKSVLFLLFFVLIIMDLQYDPSRMVVLIESFTPIIRTNDRTTTQKQSHHTHSYWLSSDRNNNHQNILNNNNNNKNSILFLQQQQQQRIKIHQRKQVQLHLLPPNIQHDHPPVSLQRQEQQKRQQQSVFTILRMTSNSSVDSRSHKNDATATEGTIFSSSPDSISSAIKKSGIKHSTQFSPPINFDDNTVTDQDKYDTKKCSTVSGKEATEVTNDMLISSIKRIVARSEDILMLDPTNLNKQNNNKNTLSLLEKLRHWEKDASSSHGWSDNFQNTVQPLSRRMVFGSTLLGLGTALQTSTTMVYAKETTKPLTTTSSNPDNLLAASSSTSTYDSKLLWQVTPVNKRTGVTVFDAEQSGYTVAFVTYLSRFLLCFDRDCQRWWYNRASDIPRTASAELVDKIRYRQFAAFSASVEVGLQEYTGSNGPKRFLKALLLRYCPSMETVQNIREKNGQLPLSSIEILKKEKEINEARRQIVLLFGLMEKNQPVKELKKILAAIDNGSIARVEVMERGSGYAPGYGSPEVRFPPPDARGSSTFSSGSNNAVENALNETTSLAMEEEVSYVRATGRAVLSPNGKILRIDVVNRGIGYSKPPEVTISAPALIRFRDRDTLAEYSTADDTTAKAKAYLFRSGPNKGRIERIQLTYPGDGYQRNEIIRVKISPPELSRQDGGETATATAVLEYEVSDIIITNNGTGYASDAPVNIYVEPPPLTARVNMNDPLIVARFLSKNNGVGGSGTVNEWLPAMDPRLSTKMQNVGGDGKDPSSSIFQINFAANKGGQSGCIGRECYDISVKAIGYPRPMNNKGIFSQYDSGGVIKRIQIPKESFVSASSSTGDVPLRLNLVGGDSSSSSQLLSLLPSGIGLQFNTLTKQYELAVDRNYFLEDSFNNKNTKVISSSTPGMMTMSTTRIEPDFGPRGRQPIQRDMELGFGAYSRFVLSGAICCSGVHLLVTPIDVVKTKVQADPVTYPGVIQSFKRVIQEEGIEGLAQGWLPTFIGFFLWGGLSYALTEYLRRVGAALVLAAASTTVIGASAVSPNTYEVPIILAAAGTAAAVGSFVLCPFESLRIRLVSQQRQPTTMYQTESSIPGQQVPIEAITSSQKNSKNAWVIGQQMIEEEGIGTFFKAVPLFLAKEIPFAMAKFTIFDLTTSYLYQMYPTAQEDIQLSLLVSIFGGVLGGVCAAVVSNPADVTITTMKKTKSSSSTSTTINSNINNSNQIVQPQQQHNDGGVHNDQYHNNLSVNSTITGDSTTSCMLNSNSTNVSSTSQNVTIIDPVVTTTANSSSIGSIQSAVQMVWDQSNGPSGFFRGLPLRMIFYSLVVSLQFLIYDSIRLLLGVGSDDLKLYLDVLGGALSENSDGPL